MPEILTEIEARVVGALIEKELTTPEYYPLTLNALVAACNQKTNREPVVSYGEQQCRNRSTICAKKSGVCFLRQHFARSEIQTYFGQSA
jgi:uncharacterized protein YceH (UPF0502 family)